MQDIDRVWGREVAIGKELYIQAWIYDWKWTVTQTGFSITHIIHDKVDVQLLGRRLRTFKPRTPISVQVRGIIHKVQVY